MIYCILHSPKAVELYYNPLHPRSREIVKWGIQIFMNVCRSLTFWAPISSESSWWLCQDTTCKSPDLPLRNKVGTISIRCALKCQYGCKTFYVFWRRVLTLYLRNCKGISDWANSKLGHFVVWLSPETCIVTKNKQMPVRLVGLRLHSTFYLSGHGWGALATDRRMLAMDAHGDKHRHWSGAITAGGDQTTGHGRRGGAVHSTPFAFWHLTLVHSCLALF